MAEYEINKGIGRELEIKGFRGRHIGSLLKGASMGLGLMIVMMLSGFHILLSVLTLIIALSATFYYVSNQSVKYGQHGLMKKSAAGKRAKYLISRAKVFSNLKRCQMNEERH